MEDDYSGMYSSGIYGDGYDLGTPSWTEDQLNNPGAGYEWSNFWNSLTGSLGSLGSGLLGGSGGSGTTSGGIDYGQLLAALGGGLLGSYNGSQQAGETTTKTVPWDLQQPYLLDMFGKAREAANAGMTPNTYQQQALADLNASRSNALRSQSSNVLGSTMGLNPANMYGQNQMNPYADKNTTVGNNPYAGANPYLENAINRSLGDVQTRINSQFSGNNYGTTAHQETLQRGLGDQASNMRMQDYGIQQGLAESDINRRMAAQQSDYNRGASLYDSMFNRNNNMYQYGMNTMNNAAINAPNYLNASLQPSRDMWQMGSQLQQMPWQNVQNYGQAISGNYGQSQSNPYFTNPWASAAGGAMTGASLYNSVFGGNK